MQSFLSCRQTIFKSLPPPASTRRNTISALQAAFKDPSSPFHIPPGTRGPASPDSPASSELEEQEQEQEQEQEKAKEEEKAKDEDPIKTAAHNLTQLGFDPASFWEQRIVWGDQDAFQHVNNVRYMRFFESSRMQWVTSIAHEIGGPPKVSAMLKGHGVSLILKSIHVRFRRPVTYPDTLLIGYRPNPPEAETEPEDPTILSATASAYSVAQQTVVAVSNECLVWYDYDRLGKVVPDERTRDVVFGRGR